MVKLIASLTAGIFLLGATSLSLSALTAQSGAVAIAQSGPAFSDEFDGAVLDPTKWDVIKGNPTVSNEKLTLPGSTTPSLSQPIGGHRLNQQTPVSALRFGPGPMVSVITG